MQGSFQRNIPRYNSHVSFKCSVWQSLYFSFRECNNVSPPNVTSPKKFYPEIINLATLQNSPSSCIGIPSTNWSELCEQDSKNLSCFTWFPSLSCGDKSSRQRRWINKLRAKGGQRLKYMQSKRGGAQQIILQICLFSHIFVPTQLKSEVFQQPPQTNEF